VAKILVVDDSKTMRSQVAQILTRAGHTVFLARDWTETMVGIRRKPDIAIVDLQLPGVDGKSIITTLKRHYPAIKTLLFSGDQEGALMKEAHSCGADAWLVKSDTDKLPSAVADLLTG
jgi:DNA-binding response OmpR family regulator